MKQRWIWLVVWETGWEMGYAVDFRLLRYFCYETREEARKKLKTLREDHNIAYWELRKLPMPAWRT